MVEDKEVAAAALCMLLEDDGHVVTIAKSYAAALEAIEGDSHDVALLDISLPDGDGKDLVGVVKARWPSTKVFLATGSAVLEHSHEDLRFEDIEEVAAKVGADGCLSKPIDYGRLTALLNSLL